MVFMERIHYVPSAPAPAGLAMILIMTTVKVALTENIWTSPPASIPALLRNIRPAIWPASSVILAAKLAQERERQLVFPAVLLYFYIWNPA
jgi:hypothetical protein